MLQVQLSALVTSPPVGRPILRVVKAGSVSREAVRKVQPSFCVADVPVSNWIARVAEAEARARVRWSTCSRPQLRGTPDPRLARATWSSNCRAVFFWSPAGGPGDCRAAAHPLATQGASPCGAGGWAAMRQSAEPPAGDPGDWRAGAHPLAVWGLAPCVAGWLGGRSVAPSVPEIQQTIEPNSF